jgi:hypothetical protein
MELTAKQNFKTMAKATKKNPTSLGSKATKISRIYDDKVIDAVKCFTFKAKKNYGTCSLSGKAISKGDKCEMLVLEDGTRVTTLLSTTIAKGKKAGKVQSTSIPSKKVAKPTAKAVKKRSIPCHIAEPTTEVVKEETKSPFSFAKASVNSKAVREALVSLALASDNEKQSILEALPLNVALTIIDLTK